MTFRIYKNRKTRHPSISIKSGDKKKWHNLEVTHSPVCGQKYIEIDSLIPSDKKKSFVRKYYRKDKHKLKGFRYKNYKLSKRSEYRVKDYLKKRHKRKKMM